MDFRTTHLQLSIGVLLVVLSARAQTTMDPTAHDSELPAPTAWSKSGAVDSAALDVMKKSRGNEGQEWVGFQAVGTLKYGPESPGYRATLTVLDSEHTRLDIETPEGVISSRLSGASGGLKVGESPVLNIDARDAIRGLIVLPLALMSSPHFGRLGIRSSRPITLGTEPNNRITISHPLPPSIRSGDLNVSASVTDLYFSTATGQLLKSVDMVHKPGNSPQLYKRVLTYSDFKTVDARTIPMQYDLTLNGQHAWSLKLSSVNAVPSSDTKDYFTF